MSSFISVSNGQFIKNGQPFRFNGTNAYYLPVYQHLSQGVVGRAFDTFEEAGIKVIRMWAFYDGPPEFQGERTMQPNAGQYDEDALKDLDQVIAAGKARGFHFILSFVNFWTQLGGVSQYNLWAGESDPGNSENRMEKFIDGSQQQGWYRDYIEMLLTRENTETEIDFRDEPAIMAWEIINEGRMRSANDDGTKFRNWYQQIAQFIKSIDSNHMVTTGEEGFDEGTPSEYSVNEYSDTYVLRTGECTSYLKNTAIPEIDFGRAHWYAHDWGFGFNFRTSQTERENILRAQEAWIKDHNNIAANHNKPFCMLEWSYPVWQDDRQEVLNQLYVPFYRTIEQEGVAGSCIWQLVAGHPKQSENGGNISYPLDPSFGRQDHILFAEFQKHSINMSETPDQDPPVVIDSSITLVSVHDNRFTVSVNAAQGGPGLRYTLFYSTQDNLGSTPEQVEQNGTEAGSGIDQLTLEALGLNPDTQYWYTILVENNSGDKAMYDIDDVTTLAADTVPPVISDGTLTVSNVSSNSFRVNFIKATDSEAPDEELVYRIYVSSTNTLDGSISEIESNGVLKDERVDTDFLVASGLFHSTEYFFNVIVEDPSGNKAAYTAGSVNTIKQQGIDRNHPMAQSLIAYYQFDQGEGDSVEDISNTDNQHNAIARDEKGIWSDINDDTVWVKRENESEWLEIANHPDLNFGSSSPFTIGLFCAFGENNDFWNFIYHKGHWPGYHLSFAGWNDILRVSIGSIVHEININSGIKNDLNNLYSIVLVVKAVNEVADLYINGSHIANLDLSAQVSSTTSGHNLNLPLPSTAITTQVHYNRLAVWRRALSAQEVSAWHDNKDLMLAAPPDEDPPVITNPSLTTSSVMDTAFTVNFEKAVDAATPPGELIYRLYISTADNVSTIEDAESNGILQDTRTNTDFLQASDLDPNTQYWFNVIVEDPSGNKAAYNSNNVTTMETAPVPGIDTNHSMAAALRLYLQFDEGSGNTVGDISNSANTHNAQAQGQGGQWNTIDGEKVWSKRMDENEWLEVANHSDLNFGTSSPFTIGLFCAFGENNDHWNDFFKKGHHPGYHLSFPGWENTIRVTIGSVTTDPNNIGIPSGIKNDLNNLHSIVLVVKGADDEADLYVNGSFMGNLDLAGQSSTTTSSNALTLPLANASQQDFEVHYNRFAVWGRALSAQEVSDWHNDKDLMLISDSPQVADGTLEASDVAFTVNFQKATDNNTPQEDLVYRLYTSTTNALDGSVESIESMGTLQDTQTDTSQLTAVGLDPNKTYFYNVIVENLEGVKTTYVASRFN